MDLHCSVSKTAGAVLIVQILRNLLLSLSAATFLTRSLRSHPPNPAISLLQDGGRSRDRGSAAKEESALLE
jgi:hypothetical protein